VWRPELATIIGEKEGATTNDGVTGRVGNRAKEEKGWVVVVAATIGTTTALVGEIILNSLITGVIFEEIALSNLGATVKTLLIMIILTRLVQSTIRCP